MIRFMEVEVALIKWRWPKCCKIYRTKNEYLGMSNHKCSTLPWCTSLLFTQINRQVAIFWWLLHLPRPVGMALELKKERFSSRLAQRYLFLTNTLVAFLKQKMHGQGTPLNDRNMDRITPYYNYQIKMLTTGM